jgi:acyl-CoA reductase-like NAD-dependent aldehyde dehydrogenase
MKTQADPVDLEPVTRAARDTARWSARSIDERAAILVRVSAVLASRRQEFAVMAAREIGKPVSIAHAEIDRCVALIGAAVRQAREPLEVAHADGPLVRRLPLGVVAAITPWNNPIAIPIGKIAPALMFGNVVAWKPAPAAARVADHVYDCFREAGLPESALVVIHGDNNAARALMEHPAVDAVTLSGSPIAGSAAHEVCARRRIRFQAELGGNNAAIVWSDADLDEAAAKIADGAFAFAGQRCTANRRVIVHEHCYDPFLDRLALATRHLSWGDPLDPATRIGPIVSPAAADRIRNLVDRARRAGHTVIVPHEKTPGGPGVLYPPTIVLCDDEHDEMVQEESFGPILVVQRARNWDDAMGRCNGVRQGLAAALFSSSADIQERFLAEAQAGVLKLNAATADVGVDVPFGGWKASGSGAPKHGAANREFYTRFQTIYR